MRIHSNIEIRDEGKLFGVIVQEGRASTGSRREVFVPGAVRWPSDGVALRIEHGTPELMRVFPQRDREGRIVISGVRATPEIRDAIDSGASGMSIEFFALQDRMTATGIREIIRAMMDGAAIVRTPEYDTTSAEIRSHSHHHRRIWL